MKKLLIFIILLLTFVNVRSQEADFTEINVRNWIIYQGDTIGVARMNGDTLFYTLGSTLDTIVITGTNYWTLTGSDIQNNNAGKVILTKDSTYFSGIPDVATKVGRILHVNQYGKIEYLTPATLADTLAVSGGGPWTQGSGVIYPTLPTDKIKDVYVSDKRNQGLITFSFDDGFMTDYTIMKPLFAAKNAVATSNIIQIKIGDPGCMDWAEIQALQDDGWEICSHGIDAARCDTLTEAELEYVMKASRDTLIAHGMDISTFVYAGGRYSDTAMMVARKYYRAARSTIMYSPNPVETNPFQFNYDVFKTYALTSVITDDPADSNEVYNLIDSAAVNKLWLILYIHETNSADSAIIANYIDYIQAKGEDSLQIVTIDQALDIRGNQIDASDGFAVNGKHVKIDGTIYKGFYPFIYTPGDTSVSDARNLFIGFAGNQTLSPAGGAVTLASRNNAIGYDALELITTGYNNSVFGDLTMAKTTTGYQNSAYGNGALWSNTEGYSNTAIGFKPLYYNTTGYQNTAIGLNSGYYSTASNNTFVGVSSGYGASSSCTGGTNVAVGALSLEKYNTADGTVAIGYGTLNSLTSGDYNVAIGSSAGGALTTGGQHTMIGYRAGRYDVTTNANVIIGADAGLGVNGSSTYGYSTIVGYKSGYSLTTGNYNTTLGYNAGYTVATGGSNVMIGYRSGYNETGSHKFYLASDSTSSTAGMLSGSKLLLYGDQSNADKANHTLNIFAKTQIGAAKAPAYTLDVAGTGFYSDDLTLDDNLAFVGAGQISTTGNGTMTLDVGTGKVDVSGDLDYDLSHGYMYYYERSDVINLTNNVYSKLTNATNNLFTVDEANGITIAGDSITITRAGDYTLWFNFSAVGAGSADAYRLKLYKNGSAILGSIKASALKSDISTVWHIQDLAVGDDIAIYLTNTVDNDDITAVDCSIYIRKEHD